jgi:hypothetical protein
MLALWVLDSRKNEGTCARLRGWYGTEQNIPDVSSWRKCRVQSHVTLLGLYPEKYSFSCLPVLPNFSPPDFTVLLWYVPLPRLLFVLSSMPTFTFCQVVTSKTKNRGECGVTKK